MSHIILERHGAVGVITLDRRERYNAFDVTMAQDFRKAALQLARDETVRAVVIRGAGGVFSSGADLKYIHAGGDAADLGYLLPETAPRATGYGAVFKQILEYLHSTIAEIRRAPKPFVAAVDGMAAAGGFGVAMACDLVAASPRAAFEWAYGRTGLTGAESSTFFLPRLVGFRRAMELVLLNPRLDARTALAWGLVTVVYPQETFDADVLALAHRLAEGPTRGFAVAKRLLNDAMGGERLDPHLDLELAELARSADGEEFAAGLDGFLAKRRVRFSEP